jgi:hypothetical protein
MRRSNWLHELRASLGHSNNRRARSAKWRPTSARRPKFEHLEERRLLAIDYGDAPDTSAGTGPGNYNSLASDNGPSHVIVPGLRIGAVVDGDSGTLQNTSASADDVNGALPDDEDGVSHPAADLELTIGANQGAPGFTLFDVPGQSRTVPQGINDLGQVVGVVHPAALGFVRDGANITTFDSPGPHTTTFTGINNSGVIVGYNIIGAAGLGFVKNGPSYTSFAVPGFDSTLAYGINDAGHIVGYYEDVDNPNNRGFLWDGNTYTFIDMPLPGTISTTAYGINNHGVVVGSFQDAQVAHHGFIKTGNTYTQIDVPNGQGTVVHGINDAGQIVGRYFANAQDARGFVKNGATYTTIHIPGADDTNAVGINNAGQIVGSYSKEPYVGGFIYTPPAPGPTVSLRVTNTTGAAATLYGWIDYNADGVFDNATERASIAAPNGTNNGIVTLAFPTVPSGFAGTTYARFRLSTDAAAANPTGAASDGEVEDYRVTINMPGDGTADSARNQKIAGGIGGGPALVNGDMFGAAVAALGDFDGDGIEDIAVGAPSQFGSGSSGAVHIQFMNASGTVKSSQRIASGVGGGPALAAGDYFGHSVASMGDLDSDGIIDLAVGADKDDTGGYNRGAVHVLFMNADGTVQSSQKIAHNFAGGPALANLDRFGSSAASLGDLDGDGITDLAVGASGDDTGGNYRGAVHVLFMNADGTVKGTQKIASGMASAPLLANGDEFGINLASLGDMDGDGITELAVGAFRDDTGGIGRGAVHVLFMNADGTVKHSTKIASGIGGAPVLGDGDYFGRSVASLGDLDGDGVTDLAVGAYRDETGGASRGAVHVLFMNANGTVKRAEKIAHLTGGGPVLANDNRFGSGVAAIGDLDGDGVIELAVGAETDGTGGNARGAVHVLFLQPGNTAPVFTSSATANVPENTTTVMTVTAMDADVSPQSVSFSLVGGIDQSKFSITTSGVLSFISPPNFEAPADLNSDNIYTVTVQASDGDGGTATQEITVNLTPINDNPPIITSADTLNVPENTTAVLTVAATDADLPPQAVTFSIVGGVDQAKFNITSGGVLSFNTPPDFEAPADVNGDNVYVVIVQASDGNGRTTNQTVHVTVTENSDLGDAPDATPGTGPGNYNTRFADNGPRHHIVNGLRIGANIDHDDGFLQNGTANADDLDNALPDDEDGVSIPAADLVLTIGAQPTVNLRVTNTTGTAATLYGWIDYNADGAFDNATERASVAVPDATNNGAVNLTFPTVPAGYHGTTFARFRLSTDTAAGNPSGLASNGEVEDHQAKILSQTDLTADSSKTHQIPSQGDANLGIDEDDNFGYSVGAIGDVDGDGVIDLAVGALRGIFEANNGAVHVLLMNVNGTVRQSHEFTLPSTPAGSAFFGRSVAGLGDLDGDGVPDVAAGESQYGFGKRPGGVQILFLNSNGTLKSRRLITEGSGGGPDLGDQDDFGRSITSLGDLDGDGVQDLAVGATGDNGRRGAVHFLYMNPNGTVKSSQKIASGVGGLPTFEANENFGRGVASLGDIDGDGVTDLAVSSERRVYVCFLNANGTVKSTQPIGSFVGRAVASLGDLDGDGVGDLAIGDPYHDAGISGESHGAVYLLLLNPNGAIKKSQKISHQAGGGPTLGNRSGFGRAISAIADLDGDGRTDLAVGSNRFTPVEPTGAVYVLFLKNLNSPPVFSSPATANVSENTTAVLTVVATDADQPAQTLTYSIVGGTDQSNFNITSQGSLSFKSPPDFEAPADANGDNVYFVTVQANDGNGGVATQNLVVRVTPVNEHSPVFTLPDVIYVAEETTAVTNLKVTDGDLPPPVITYSIVGGADQSQFLVTSGGALSFDSPPDFAAPTDANGDNVYVVIVKASDGSLTNLHALLVTVTSNNEVPVALAGDYNNNGTVGAADYIVWRKSLGSSVLLPNDTTPGSVTQLDYNVWRANFGRTVPPASGASSFQIMARSEGPLLDAGRTTHIGAAAIVKDDLAAAAASSFVRVPHPRPVVFRSARRDALIIRDMHDDALQAWLTSQSSVLSSDTGANDFDELPHDREIHEAVDALDLAFATL